MKTLLTLIFSSFISIAASQNIFINEIHYDNSGADTNEGIEIAGPAGFELNNWKLLFYNGSNGEIYNSRTLNFTFSNDNNGLGFEFINVSGIQNGPDAIALVDNNNNLIQFLSYEGEFTGTEGVANGISSTNIGVSQSSSGTIGHSLQLIGTGNKYEDFSWQSNSTSTYNAVNNAQTILPGASYQAFYLIKAEIESSQNIKLYFNDTLNTNLNLLTVTSQFNNLQIEITDDTVLALSFNPIEKGKYYPLHIEGIKNDNNSQIQSLEKEFIFNDLGNDLVITEIYHSDPSGIELEFLELYNTANHSVNLGGLYFDQGIEFAFDTSLSLGANEFMVLCDDLTDFASVFDTNGQNIIEWESGALSNSGEPLVIKNTLDLVDSVYYRGTKTWSDIDNSSIEIIDPIADNNEPENWRNAKGFAAIYNGELIYASPGAFSFPSYTPLSIVAIHIISANEIKLEFSKPGLKQNLSLNEINGLGEINAYEYNSDSSAISLLLNTPLIYSKEYEIHVSTNFISDEIGLALITEFQKTFFYNDMPQKLVITEIMWNLPGTDNGYEFIEIYNPNESDINLFNFYFSNGIDHVFGKEDVIKAKSFYLLAQDAKIASSFYSESFKQWQSGSLNNTREEVVLLDPNGKLVDEVLYTKKAPWPSQSNGKGSSLEIIDFTIDNYLNENWRASPYYVNNKEGDEIFASPARFAIENSGYFSFKDSVVYINEGALARIQINLKQHQDNKAEVNFKIEGGNLDSTEYVILTEETIKAKNGNGPYYIEIQSLRDARMEDNESLTLSLNSPRHAEIGTFSTCTLVVRDVNQTAAKMCLTEVFTNRLTLVGNQTGVNPFIELYNNDSYSFTSKGLHLKIDMSNNTVFEEEIKQSYLIHPETFQAIWLDSLELIDSLENLMLDDVYPDYVAIYDNENKTLLTELLNLPDLINTSQSYGRTNSCNSAFIIADPTPNYGQIYSSITTIDANNIAVYPNPSKGMVNFNSIQDFRLFNNVGQLMLSGTSIGIDLSKFASGIYLLSTESGKIKIVKP